jgi:hypothetical protein
MQKAVALINYSARRVEIDFCVEAKNFMTATVDDQITIHDERFKNKFISGKIIKTRFAGSADRKIIKFTIGCRGENPDENFERLRAYKIEIDDDDSKINPADIVKNVQIENPPEEQIATLSQTTAHSVAELQKKLKPTKIKLTLHPLSTTRSIVREITLPQLEAGHHELLRAR